MTRDDSATRHLEPQGPRRFVTYPGLLHLGTPAARIARRESFLCSERIVNGERMHDTSPGGGSSSDIRPEQGRTTPAETGWSLVETPTAHYA